MGSKGLGMGVAHIFGVLTVVIASTIVIVLYMRNAESAVAAKQSADQTLEEVRGILDARTSEHQRAIEETQLGPRQRAVEDTRRGLNLPDPYSR